MANLHIGFDDTDSPRGGCTTYIAALLVEKLEEFDVTFNDYPNLIRLNPNVPWKTRGNGALCLRISYDKSHEDTIFEVVADVVEEKSDLGFENTDPGIVFFYSAKIPREMKNFAKSTITGIVKMQEALRLVRKFKAEALGFGTGYGLVGALAAIGETLDGDYTYEVIAYRTPENIGTNRKIDLESVRDMNEKTAPQTFNNVDPETKRILITPRGPDPILYGIRGETAEAVVKAHEIVQSFEPVERWVVFRTNHGTDAHLRKVEAVSDIKAYNPVIATGTVASEPKLVPKRHRIFSIKDETGSIDCAAYEPTGTLRKIAGQLIVGDEVEIYGGVSASTSKHPLTVNLEKLQILKLAPKLKFCNPKCPECGKGMSSMGVGQGLRCPKCGFRSSQMRKIEFKKHRKVAERLFITSPRSQRHLTKPLVRYGNEKVRTRGWREKMLLCWHYP